MRVPETAPGFREIKIEEAVRQTLRFDAGREVVWKTADASAPENSATNYLFFFRWNPGSSSVVRARAHRPDICLPSVGWKQTGDRGVKTYVADPRMAPFAIVLDPEVTLMTPAELWLSSGVKVVDHACEMLWGPRSHPFTDTLAQEALCRIRRSLPLTRAEPEALEPRLDCQLAGWMSMAGIVNVRVHQWI